MARDGWALRGEEHECDSCGKRGDDYYVIAFYILPTRLVRKRHRLRGKRAWFCRECYEADPDLPVLADGARVTVAKSPVRPDKSPCLFCRSKTPQDINGLYGVVTSLLRMGDSIIECLPLAFVCSDCVETHQVGLVTSI
jgi:hypothetical protein